MAEIKGRDNYDTMPTLDGVEIVPPGGAAGEVLKKNSTTDFDYSWGSSGVQAFDALTDTNITAVAAGEVLKWDGTDWINNTLAEAGIAAASHNHTLDGLSNTTITAIASGEVLKWNGSAWINNTLAEAGIAAVGGAHHDGFSDYVADEHATPKNSIEINTAQLQLVNDAASPGNNKVYGTNGSGVKGWQDAGGGILQMVETSIPVMTTAVVHDMNVAPTIASGTEIASVSITPANTANKIMIVYNFLADLSADRAPQLFLFRNSTLINISEPTGFKRGYGGAVSFMMIDSPATTSPITYSLRGASSGATLSINQSNGGDTWGGTSTTGSKFTALELKIG